MKRIFLVVFAVACLFAFMLKAYANPGPASYSIDQIYDSTNGVWGVPTFKTDTTYSGQVYGSGYHGSEGYYGNYNSAASAATGFIFIDWSHSTTDWSQSTLSAVEAGVTPANWYYDYSDPYWYTRPPNAHYIWDWSFTPDYGPAGYTQVMLTLLPGTQDLGLNASQAFSLSQSTQYYTIYQVGGDRPVNAVPEPSSLILLMSGLSGLAILRFKK